MTENIHPIFESILKKGDKESLLNQKGMVIWLIGLSGSGKSTIARVLENKLHQEKVLTQILDGDNLRSGLNHDLGFTDEERVENIRRTAEVARLFANCGVVTLCSFITPTEEIRKMARKIIGEDYFEVYVSCTIEECEARDVKGLYNKARKGEIPGFTGIDSPFEEPLDPQLILNTKKENIEESVENLYGKVVDKIKNRDS